MSESLSELFRARRFGYQTGKGDTLAPGYHGAHYAAKHRTAREALKLAREDVQAGRRVYSVPDARGRFPGSNRGAVFAHAGESRCVWIERPESFGLRFVGKAHDISKRNYAYMSGIEHTGWYIDSDESETVHGVVYQLPGRDGCARYMFGYADPHNDGPACLSIEVITGERGESEFHDCASYKPTARDAAERADSMAKSMAEESREYDSAWQAGRRFEDLAEDVKTWRTEALAILKERRAVKGAEAPTLCAVIRARVESILESIQEAREERAELLADAKGGRPDAAPDTYQARAWTLWCAFCEGADMNPESACA